MSTTAQRRGWGGIKNRELLRMAEDELDFFITSEQGIRYQQNLARGRIAIIKGSINKLRRITAALKLDPLGNRYDQARPVSPLFEDCMKLCPGMKA